MVHGQYRLVATLFFVLSNLIAINTHAKKTFNNKKKNNHVIEYNTGSNVNRRTYNLNDNRYIKNDAQHMKKSNHPQVSSSKNPTKLKKGVVAIRTMQERKAQTFNFNVDNNKQRSRRHLLKLDSEVTLEDSIGIQKGGKGGQSSSKPASNSRSSKGGSKSGSSNSGNSKGARKSANIAKKSSNKAAKSTKGKSTKKGSNKAAKSTKKGSNKAAKSTKKGSNKAAKSTKKSSDKAAKSTKKSSDKAAKSAKKSSDKAAKSAKKSTEKSKKGAKAASDKSKKSAKAVSDKSKKSAKAVSDKSKKSAKAASDKSKKSAKAASNKSNKASKASSKISVSETGGVTINLNLWDTEGASGGSKSGGEKKVMETKMTTSKVIKHVFNGSPHEDHAWGGSEVYKYHRSDLDRDSDVYIPASVQGIWKHARPSLYDVGAPLPQKPDVKSTGKNVADDSSSTEQQGEIKKQVNGMPLDVGAPLNPPSYKSTSASGEMES